MGDWSDNLEYEQREYYGHFYDPDREEEPKEEELPADTVEIIIKIPKVPKNDHERWVLAHGTPLDFLFVFRNYCEHCKCYMPFKESEDT